MSFNSVFILVFLIENSERLNNEITDLFHLSKPVNDLTQTSLTILVYLVPKF